MKQRISPNPIKLSFDDNSDDFSELYINIIDKLKKPKKITIIKFKDKMKSVDVSSKLF